MFAGVGGFRLALEGYGQVGDEFYRAPAGDYETVWANQWEPPGTDSKQFAWQCYEEHFGEGSCINEDIGKVLDEVESGNREIPNFDMLVGGFPCQDYSVAKPLSLAGGIEGKKGVLWWDIYRMVMLKRPKYLLLENVDRLLKSPATRRGRDFAIILSCLNNAGYSVEWRVINAADYGMPQKRKRVYIYGELAERRWDKEARLFENGVMARAFPVSAEVSEGHLFGLPSDPYEASETFGVGLKVSPFAVAGVMQDGKVFTAKVEPVYDGDSMTLGDLVVPDAEVPEQFFIDGDKLKRWKYLKGSKREPRMTAAGFEYMYSEGAMAFPDSLDKPARTILTGEGGRSPSRMKHVIIGDSGKYRRLVPDELDQVQMFPKGWTRGMSDGHRAFCMGNALVVDIPYRIGKELAHI